MAGLTSLLTQAGDVMSPSHMLGGFGGPSSLHIYTQASVHPHETRGHAKPEVDDLTAWALDGTWHLCGLMFTWPVK